MTILIPDSWELPSYLAGDVVNMDNYRDRERATVPDKDRAPGQNARIFDLDYTRSMKTPPQPLVDLTPDWDAGQSHMETYDPSKDEPAELYNQSDLDALHDAGFHPTEPGVWHRPVANDKGESLGASHTIIYEPGHRQTSNGRLIPWHVMSDQEGIGTAHPTLHGALTSVNAEAERVRKMPRHSRLYTPGVKMAARSPGRANADDWLERNSPESFEEDPRAAAHDWMDENADQYTTWHPDNSDYTYRDFGDTAGQTFHEGEDEGRAHVLPGSHYHPEADRETGLRSQPTRTYVDHPHSSPSDAEQAAWDSSPQHALPGEDRPHREGWTPRDWQMFHYEPPAGGRPNTFGDPHEDDPSSSWSPEDLEAQEHVRSHSPVRGHQPEPDENDEDGGVSQDEQDLADHGFDWRANDPTAGTPGNPYTPETPGHYYRYQHDPEGNHIATHTISPIGNGRWRLESGPSDTQDFLTSYTEHMHAGDALDKYRQNAAEALLPQRGYEPHRGRTGWATHWTRTDHAPGSNNRHEDYEHEISMPEGGGFLGQTENGTFFPHSQFALNGNQAHHAHDLADVVREQDRLGRGVHPGGHQDHRVTSEELHADPTVARLGRPETTSTPWGDGRVGRMTWRLPSPPHGRDLPVNAEANYNWDTGNYDFKYTHDGTTLAATHNYVPDGAPVTVPGRQPQLSLDARG